MTIIQTKNDRKDPKTIAALVNEGRFSYPYIPTGIYAEIRVFQISDYKPRKKLQGSRTVSQDGLASIFRKSKTFIEIRIL